MEPGRAVLNENPGNLSQIDGHNNSNNVGLNPCFLKSSFANPLSWMGALAVDGLYRQSLYSVRPVALQRPI